LVIDALAPVVAERPSAVGQDARQGGLRAPGEQQWLVDRYSGD